MLISSVHPWFDPFRPIIWHVDQWFDFVRAKSSFDRLFVELRTVWPFRANHESIAPKPGLQLLCPKTVYKHVALYNFTIPNLVLRTSFSPFIETCWRGVCRCWNIFTKSSVKGSASGKPLWIILFFWLTWSSDTKLITSATDANVTLSSLIHILTPSYGQIHFQKPKKKQTRTELKKVRKFRKFSKKCAFCSLIKSADFYLFLA